MVESMGDGEFLKLHLEVAVPLWILRVRDYPEVMRRSRAQACAQVVAEKGDVIQFKSKKKGETAAAFNHLAEGLACLAFAPGGVKFMGLHWEADPGGQAVG